MASGDPRLSFEEAMELAELPLSPEAAAAGVTRRFISRRPAYLPGSDIEEMAALTGPGKVLSTTHRGAFGGHVYSQAAAAVDHAAREEARQQTGGAGETKYGVHVGVVPGAFNRGPSVAY